MSGSPTVRQWSTCLSALLHVSRVCERVADTVCVCVCVCRLTTTAPRDAPRDVSAQQLHSSQLAAHSNCEFECLNCILFVANSLLQQLKANFAAHHRHPPSAPCSTATTAGSALGFLINAAGGDIHRTWQRGASSKHQGARSTAHRAALAFLLYFRFATKIARHFANVGCRN